MPFDPSKIIREFCVTTGGLRVVLRTITYINTFDFFLALFEDAKRFFPNLQPENVEIVYYDGEPHARTFGIEFKADSPGDIPAEFNQISELKLVK
ncbi:MAG: hypothetical protein WC544_01140 [Patescibacteria group bacterium]